ncbi:B-cell differentiation antigen CD72-like [Aegotheles albertisi]
MANSVVYADLKFAAGPPPAAPAAPEEDDSPYENVALGPVPAAPTPGRWPRRWPRRWGVPAGVLAAGLLLLLVATVTLGACYWQVTRRMQDTSREHAAEQGRLSQEVSTREQSLEQTRLELARARAELQRAWQEGNGSRLELESLSRELRRVTGVLGRTEQELQEVQGKLNNSKSTVAALRACVNTDCCPQGWVLYRSKCLFISVQENNWYNSDHDCKMKSAQLLVEDHWPSWTVPHFVQVWGATYWVGAKFSSGMKGTSARQSSKDFSLYRDSSYCRLLDSGKIASNKCSQKHQWICEQPPKLTSPSKTLLPLVVKD